MTQPTQKLSGTALLRQRLKTLQAFFRYNANNVFAGKFIYFILFAIALFLFVIVIYTLNTSVPPEAADVYFFLLTPGIVLVFYPSVYGIDNDTQSRMIETLFGIPDYRYKVWLARNLALYAVVTLILLSLALLCRFVMTEFNVTSMVFHVLFPIAFIGSLGFMLSTITRSGNGTTAIMIVIMLVFFSLDDVLEGSRWDLFFNPFESVEAFVQVIHDDNTLYNRIYIISGIIIASMFSLLRLQKREKFI
ncbi:MAG: hypothetical protein KAR42_07830 [candidate division Zixibacteria bacterium]|nr:hypothetical protein [candidate division Zixibacteria bacterium]